MSAMFVGAYWSGRKESRTEVATRLAHLLAALAGEHESLATWHVKGWSRARAQAPIDLGVESLAAQLKVNRRDLGGGLIPELGFSLGLWNGADVSLTATVGAHGPHVKNAVVLSFSERPMDFSVDTWKNLLCILVREFDPEHGVVTSTDYLNRRAIACPWEAGWFTCSRGAQIVEHPFEWR